MKNSCEDRLDFSCKLASVAVKGRRSTGRKEERLEEKLLKERGDPIHTHPSFAFKEKGGEGGSREDILLERLGKREEEMFVFFSSPKLVNFELTLVKVALLPYNGKLSHTKYGGKKHHICKDMNTLYCNQEKPRLIGNQFNIFLAKFTYPTPKKSEIIKSKIYENFIKITLLKKQTKN